MEIIKKSERTLNTNVMLSTIRKCGGQTEDCGRYCKWLEIEGVGRIQRVIDVYKIVTGETVGYFMSKDSFMMCSATKSLSEITDWLKEHGWKTEHDWFIEDNGGTEESWRRWNSNGEDC